MTAVAVGVKEHTYPPNLRRDADLAQPERIASTVAGGLLLAYGLRNPTPVNLLLGVLGAGLLYQGAGGRNVVESVRTGQPLIAEPQGVRIKKSVTINRTPETVYAFWRNLENLARYMPNVRSVQRHGGGRSHWVVKGPRGTALKWDAQITVDRPNQMIAWQTLPGGSIDHRGYVKFVPAPGGRGTEVHVALEYQPPLGEMGKLLGSLLSAAAEQQIQEQMRNFKNILEAGEIPTIRGQSSGRVRGDEPQRESEFAPRFETQFAPQAQTQWQGQEVTA
jgi:uncharacterized membrane protein